MPNPFRPTNKPTKPPLKVREFHIQFDARTIFISILVFLLISSAISSLTGEVGRSFPEKPVTEIIKDIKDDKVSKVKIVEDQIVITYKGDDTKGARATKEYGESFLSTLKDAGVDVTKIKVEVTNTSTMTMIGGILSNLLPMLLGLAIFYFIFRQARGAQEGMFSFGANRAKRIHKSMQKVTFADVAGLDDAKKDLQDIIDYLKSPTKFKVQGVRPPRGVILAGPPGTGKTLLARAVAGEAGVPFFSVSGSEFMEMLVGIGAARVRDLFAMAKKSSPAIIFIDEIDAIGKARGQGFMPSHDERDQTLNQILVEMDGFTSNDNVVVMAATNRADLLDPAFLRTGRFDKRIQLTRPDAHARRSIMELHTKNKKFDPTIPWDEVTRITSGFSASDIESMLNESMLLAVKDKRELATIGDIKHAIEKLKKGSVVNFDAGNKKGIVADMPKITFADVAGIDEARRELEEVVDYLQNPDKYVRLGARIPKGVLLSGPPGCGKTLLAKAVAGEAQVPFFSASGAEFEEMLVGMGAKRVRELFEVAQKSAPSIIFIDEIDAFARSRSTSTEFGGSAGEQTLNQVLTEMDGFVPSMNVIVMAATNRPDLLDPALLRPGRFDRRVSVDYPDAEGRKKILLIHAKGKIFQDEINWDGVAKRTIGFSGAELENALNEAAILAARQDKSSISASDIEEAATKVKLGPEKKRLQSDYDRKLTAYHEAGHAIVSHFLPHTDPVHRISIVSRGMSLGHTLIPPNTDKVHETKTHLLERISVMMGGRAAEEVIFGEITTGAANDFDQATSIARAMVMEFGMSELGPINLGATGDITDYRVRSQQQPLSQEILAKVDATISQILKKQYAVAVDMVQSKRKEMDAVSLALLEKENLEKEEFEAIVGKK
jgi:cell division protease FtsH